MLIELIVLGNKYKLIGLIKGKKWKIIKIMGDDIEEWDVHKLVHMFIIF